MKKLKEHYLKWKDRMSALIAHFVRDKQTALRLSLTLIALTEGMSLFSVFFRPSDLCHDIDFLMMMQSMVSDNEIQIKPHPDHL